MKLIGKLLLSTWILLYSSASLYADCIEVPIIGNGSSPTDIKPGQESTTGPFRPAIPTAITDLKGYTVSSVIVSNPDGTPKDATAISCFDDGFVIPLVANPISKQVAKTEILRRDPKSDPTVLDKIAIPVKIGSLRDYWNRLSQYSWSLLKPTLAWAGVLATDTFDRADANPATGWTTVTSETAVQTFSNLLRATSTVAISHAYLAAATPPANQYSQLLIDTFLAGHIMGPSCRVATGAETYYLAYMSTAAFTLYKVVAGAFTDLGNGSGTFAATNTIRLAAIGTGLEIFKDGVSVVTATDSAIASGRAGIYFQVSSTGSAIANNFETGDFNNHKHMPLVY